MATVVEELSKSVADVAARVAPSVVGVGAGGSGVVVGAGVVVTNAHNLRRDEMVVTFADGRRADGRPAGVDIDGDLAVVAVDTGDAPALAVAARAPGRRVGRRRRGAGQPGRAGPAGQRRIRVRRSTWPSGVPVGGKVRGAIEHTAPLARGSSGGPLVDVRGHAGRDRHPPHGRRVLPGPPGRRGAPRRVDALVRGEVPRRPRLGIAVAPPRVARRLRRSVGLPERDGLLVHAVEEGGPADRRRHARRVTSSCAWPGHRSRTVDELAAALEAVAPGRRRRAGGARRRGGDAVRRPRRAGRRARGSA